MGSLNKNDKLMQFKDIANNYQTTIRNVGLFTTISLALLGFSRYYRKKDKIYNIFGLLLSASFNILSMIILKYLLYDHAIYIKDLNVNKESDIIIKWYIIPKILLVVISVLLLLTIYTIFRQVN